MDNQATNTPKRNCKLTRTQLGYLLTFIGAIIVICVCLVIVTVQFYVDEAEKGITGSSFYYQSEDAYHFVLFNTDGTMTSYEMESLISAPENVYDGEWEIKFALFKGAGANTECGLYIYDKKTDTVTLDGQVYSRFFG